MSTRPEVTPHDIAVRLGGLPFAGRLAAADAICAEIEQPFVTATADALLAQLSARTAEDRAALEQWIDRCPESRAGAYLTEATASARSRLHTSTLKRERSISASANWI